MPSLIRPACALAQFRMLIALLVLAISITSCTLDTAQLTFHEPPKLANIPGTTEISATWSPVSNVTHYQVRWTLDNPSIEIQDATNVQEPKAAVNLPRQGLWTIEIRACIETRCGPPSGESILVIIDVLGRRALRLSFVENSQANEPHSTNLHLDWDPLPTHYVVKFRRSNHESWVQSEPLDQPGYYMTPKDLAPFSNGGELEIQVFFNCSASGAGCTLLGQFPHGPYTELNEPFLPDYLDASGNPVPTNQPGNNLVRDPQTHIPRPASDYTITTEQRDGRAWTCRSRPAENTWEENIFGTHADAIKSCRSTVTRTIPIPR